MSVKVAVRVRPFNQRETTNNAQLCIKMVSPNPHLHFYLHVPILLFHCQIQPNSISKYSQVM